VEKKLAVRREDQNTGGARLLLNRMAQIIQPFFKSASNVGMKYRFLGNGVFVPCVGYVFLGLSERDRIAEGVAAQVTFVTGYNRLELSDRA